MKVIGATTVTTRTDTRAGKSVTITGGSAYVLLLCLVA